MGGGGGEGTPYRVTHRASLRKILRYSNVKVKRQSGFLARSPSLAGKRGGENFIRKAGRMRGPLCAWIADGRPSRALVPSASPLFPPSVLNRPWHSSLHTTAIRHKARYKVSRSFPRTPGVRPSSPPAPIFRHPLVFVSLVAFSQRVLSSFRRLVFFLGAPFPRFPGPRFLPCRAVFFSPV